MSRFHPTRLFAHSVHLTELAKKSRFVLPQAPPKGVLNQSLKLMFRGGGRGLNKTFPGKSLHLSHGVFRQQGFQRREEVLAVDGALAAALQLPSEILIMIQLDGADLIILNLGLEAFPRLKAVHCRHRAPTEQFVTLLTGGRTELVEHGRQFVRFLQ